jgi:dynamin 1-like protein
MQGIIPLINKIQEALATTSGRYEIELPQIVVVGSQSCGKSSVLESIVGLDFLPRGTGIVTRRPLVLQLYNIPSGTDYAFFNHCEKEFTCFTEVKEEIMRETARLCGDNKGISHEPIYLRIFSNHVINLTLIDLPGVTKNPMGDQPKDIEKQVSNLIYDFIARENTIILAISPANTDIANSDALKMARKVDPKGERTFGVISKIDLMDEGTDAMELLQGQIYPLKLGYIGVVCRSQKDINEGKLISDSVKDEEKFFKIHPVYHKLSHNLGIRALSSKLNALLIRHIKRTLPHIRDKITSLISQKRQEIDALGADLDFEGPRGAKTVMLTVVSKYTTIFNNYINGDFVKQSTDLLLGGSRINYIFSNTLYNALDSLHPLKTLTDDDIRTCIKNASALTPCLFVEEKAFHILMRQQIARLQEPALQCAEQVYLELRELVSTITIPELERYKKLHFAIMDVMTNLLSEYLQPTLQMITNLIACENAYINVNHPDFIVAKDALLNLFKKGNDPPPEDNVFEKPEINNNIYRDSDQESDESEEDEFVEGYPRKEFFDNLMVTDNVNEVNGSHKNNTYVKRSNKKDYKYSVGYEADGNMITHIPQVGLVKPPKKMRVDTTPNGREIVETQIIKNCLSSYFNIVRKHIADLVPKTIMAFLINKTKETAQQILYTSLSEGHEIEELMGEDPMIAEARNECQDTLTNLHKAVELINEARDFNYFKEELGATISKMKMTTLEDRKEEEAE